MGIKKNIKEGDFDWANNIVPFDVDDGNWVIKWGSVDECRDAQLWLFNRGWTWPIGGDDSHTEVWKLDGGVGFFFSSEIDAQIFDGYSFPKRNRNPVEIMEEKISEYFGNHKKRTFHELTSMNESESDFEWMEDVPPFDFHNDWVITYDSKSEYRDVQLLLFSQGWTWYNEEGSDVWTTNSDFGFFFRDSDGVFNAYSYSSKVVGTRYTMKLILTDLFGGYSKTPFSEIPKISPLTESESNFTWAEDIPPDEFYDGMTFTHWEDPIIFTIRWDGISKDAEIMWDDKVVGYDVDEIRKYIKKGIWLPV